LAQVCGRLAVTHFFRETCSVAYHEGRSERTKSPLVVVSMAPGLALRTFAIAVAGLVPQNCVFKTDGFSGAGQDKTLGRKAGGFC
jgi:hypothetical protein